MLIELIGPPGCGKTTCARLLDDRLAGSALRHVPSTELVRLDREIGEHYLERIGFARRVFALARLLWMQPGVVWGVLWLAARHGPPYRKRFRRARRALGQFLLALRLRGLAEGRTVVLDESFVHRLWSLLVESDRLRGERRIREVFRQYYAAVAPIGVRLEIEDATTIARVFDRSSRGRFNRDSGEERRRAFSRWLEYHRRLVALLPAGAIRGSVDANGEPEKVADQLAAVIVALAGQAREPV